MTATATAFILPEAEKRYIQYVQDHAGEIDVVRLCEVMWNSGGRHAIMAMTSISDILPMINRIEGRIIQLRTLMELLQDDAA